MGQVDAALYCTDIFIVLMEGPNLQQCMKNNTALVIFLYIQFLTPSLLDFPQDKLLLL